MPGLVHPKVLKQFLQQDIFARKTTPLMRRGLTESNILLKILLRKHVAILLTVTRLSIEEYRAPEFTGAKLVFLLCFHLILGRCGGACNMVVSRVFL